MEYLFNFDKLPYLKGERPEGCILCLVTAGSPAVERLVVSDEGAFVVSLNLYPYNPGHLLVFPKRHVLDIRELSSEERVEFDATVDRSLAALDLVMKPAGYNIGFNMGLAAGASIDHLHLHVIPRYPREIGIAELIGGTRVLVQNPRETLERLRAAY
ncbi:MAG: HIT domain-containing protein [Treponema sp.]|nr:HIT domain-containing protein [Treponema sp.]